MKINQSRSYVVATLLLLSACTKTVYQTEEEAGASTADPTSAGIQSDDPTPTAPGNSAAAAIANDQTNSDTIASADSGATSECSVAPSPVTTAGEITADVNAAVAASAISSEDIANAPAVTGEPGAIVDCNLLVPCRWQSSAQDFSLTVATVDNTGLAGRLTVQYKLTASHDSELFLGNGSTALAPGGSSFSLFQQTLGDGNGVTPITATAGEEVVGSAIYDRPANSDSLAGWTFTVVDNGLPRTVGFINLPIGSPNAVPVDCAGVLPCQWTSNDGVTITLVAVGGYTANSRLNVNFNVLTERDMNIVLDTGAKAVSETGEIIEGRTHSLGENNGFADVHAVVTNGIMIPGNVSFFRTSRPPSSLTKLDLVIYEDIPSQRWNPQFINLPTD